MLCTYVHITINIDYKRFQFTAHLKDQSASYILRNSSDEIIATNHGIKFYFLKTFFLFPK